MKPICNFKLQYYLSNDIKKTGIGQEVFELDPKTRLFSSGFCEKGVKMTVFINLNIFIRVSAE